MLLTASSSAGKCICRQGKGAVVLSRAAASTGYACACCEYRSHSTVIKLLHNISDVRRRRRRCTPSAAVRDQFSTELAFLDADCQQMTIKNIPTALSCHNTQKLLCYLKATQGVSSRWGRRPGTLPAACPARGGLEQFQRLWRAKWFENSRRGWGHWCLSCGGNAPRGRGTQSLRA